MANSKPTLGTKNLIPIDKLTKEKQREITSAGGKASQKKQKENKTFREIGNILLNSRAKKKDLKELQDRVPDLDVKEMTVKAALFMKQVKKAEEGDTKAFEVIRDTSGEKPTDKVENVNEHKFESVKFVKGEKTIELK